MKAARMTGDWNKTRRMLAGSSRRLGKAIKQGTRAEGQTLKKELVKGITSQRPGGKRIDPPSPATLAVRRLQGIGGSKALSATRTLLKSIRVVEKAGKVFVGVPHEARGRDGKPLAQVAFAIEFGSGPVFIPLTPAMQRFLGFLMRNTPPRPKKTKRGGASDSRASLSAAGLSAVRQGRAETTGGTDRPPYGLAPAGSGREGIWLFLSFIW